MANAPEEAEEIVGISNSLVINIGTLTKEQIETMKRKSFRNQSNSNDV